MHDSLSKEHDSLSKEHSSLSTSLSDKHKQISACTDQIPEMRHMLSKLEERQVDEIRERAKITPSSQNWGNALDTLEKVWQEYNKLETTIVNLQRELEQERSEKKQLEQELTRQKKLQKYEIQNKNDSQPETPIHRNKNREDEEYSL